MTPHVQQIARLRRLRVALVGVAALALGTLAGPAGADVDGPQDPAPLSSSQCAAGTFCLWSGTGYTGTFWSTGASGLQNTPIGTAGSVWNRMPVDVRTYSGSGGTGSITCWNASAQAPTVSVGSLSVRTMTSTSC